MPIEMPKVVDEEAKGVDIRPSSRRVRKQTKKADYIIMPETDMEKLAGWRKEVKFRYIITRDDGRMFVNEVSYYTVHFPHRSCGSNEFLWLSKQRNGVYLCCTYCKTAEGPVSQEAGVTNRSYQISPKQAVEILLARGWTYRDKPVRVLMRRAKRPAKEYVPRKEAEL